MSKTDNNAPVIALQRKQKEYLEALYNQSLGDGINVSLDSDIQIGAVELKDAATDTRAKLANGSTILTTDNALAVADANVKSDTAAIKTAVEILDNAISGNEMQVDVITMPAVTVTNAGVFPVQEDGAALTALQLIDDIVKEEDSAHTTGDKGALLLAVRNDAGTSLVGTDGDYAPLQVNSLGMLNVNLDTVRDVPPEVGAGNAGGGTLRVSISTDDVNLSAIKTAVELLDNTVSGSELQVDVVTLPGTVSSDITAIKTAVEILDNTVSGSELQVDIVTMPDVSITSVVKTVATWVTTQDLTASYADFGAEIPTEGYTKIGVWVKADVNDSTTVTLQALGLHTTAGDEFELDGIGEITLWTSGASDFNKYYEIEVGAVPIIQLQAKAGTVGATAGDLTISITKA